MYAIVDTILRCDHGLSGKPEQLISLCWLARCNVSLSQQDRSCNLVHSWRDMSNGDHTNTTLMVVRNLYCSEECSQDLGRWNQAMMSWLSMARDDPRKIPFLFKAVHQDWLQGMSTFDIARGIADWQIFAASRDCSLERQNTVFINVMTCVMPPVISFAEPRNNLLSLDSQLSLAALPSY